MDFLEIQQDDYATFHQLLNAYYREGEDENTPQEEINSFIRFMFQKIINKEISGCFAKDKNTFIGFSLWAIDTKDFAFSELPGYGTILEIGLIPSYRASGFGKEFVCFIEACLYNKNVKQCYVSAYGPAQKFWELCGYIKNGLIANNGLPIMVKTIG